VSETRDRILLIDRDADESAVMADAALVPFGYEVARTTDGSAALNLVGEFKPDVIVLDLHPESLSGPDVLAALSAQAIDVPVILLADEGREKEMLNGFRLGARDYLMRPVREAELIQVLERVLKEVRLRRERTGLINEVRRAADEANQRLREIKTLMGIGKSVAALTNLNQVFDHVIRAAVQLSRADAVGIFLKDDQTGTLLLRAGQGLPRAMLDHMGKPVEDGLAAMVMNSRETAMVEGAGLQRFRPALQEASAVIYAPMVVHDSSLGLLWVANHRLSFEARMVDLLTALADYAAIAVVNAHLFTTMQDRTRQLERLNQHLRQQMNQEKASAALPERVASLQEPLQALMHNMSLFYSGEMGSLTPAQRASVDVMHRQLGELIQHVQGFLPAD